MCLATRTKLQRCMPALGALCPCFRQNVAVESCERIMTVDNATAEPGQSNQCRVINFGLNRSNSLDHNLGKTQNFRSNAISTSKYNFATFLPIFLMEQFRRYANVFFLAVSIMQQIPGVSPTGKYTTLFPLLTILTVSAIKEIYEDVKRHRQDHVVNRKKAHVFRNGTWVDVRWMDIVVGDLIKVEASEQFPCDFVLLSSSEPHAMAYIETSNLDGETNLKIRQGDRVTSDLKTNDQLANVSGRIECELPNRHLYEFHGALYLDEHSDGIPLGPEKILLRGSGMRNTDWVIGISIYTGHETKLMKNSRKAPLKRSNVDVITNYQILVLFFILCFIAITFAIFSQLWMKNNGEGAWYLGPAFFDSKTFFWDVMTFMILFNNLVPISLQVSLELVRFFQASFINYDSDIYHAATDSPAQARTSNLNDELGQVKYLLTDKTGTLTQNIMLFKQAVICGRVYGDLDTPNFSDDFLSKKYKQLEEEAISSNASAEMQVEHNIYKQFLLGMAICHTVVPETKKSNSPSTSKIYADVIYQASSPDEIALVKGARDIGVAFIGRTPEKVTIDMFGKIESYKLLYILEFTSNRKRMGAIYRCDDDIIRLYVKGADNVIMERLAPNSLYERQTISALEHFAVSGFRTLCFACREIDEEEFYHWEHHFKIASLSIDDRERKLEDTAELIEKDLILTGATAIEDKLQDGVPETIEALMQADIKIWMLTGDKRETAVNIGYSCNLIKMGMPLLYLCDLNFEETSRVMLQYLDNIGQHQIGKENDLCLIVDGRCMRKALAEVNRKNFINLATSCSVVICCRASPMQKAEIVEIIKHTSNEITMAIGDGANDVAMIQSAHVGVAITGNEGLQAASAADYTIAQFCFLKKLLFVHGSWSFHRTIKLILYSFYKNITLYLIDMWFAIYSAWSGQPIFERWTLASYNLLFTALPPIAMALFDRPLTSDLSLKHSQLYTLSQDRSAFNIMSFSLWICAAIIHSLILWFVPMGIFEHEVVWRSGRVGDWVFLGNCIYTYAVIVVCLKVGLEVETWTWPVHLAIWGSIGAWFIFVPVYSRLYFLHGDFINASALLYSSKYYWISILVVPVIALYIDFIHKVIRRTFFKTTADAVRELELNEMNILEKFTRRSTGETPTDQRSIFTCLSSQHSESPGDIDMASPVEVVTTGSPSPVSARLYVPIVSETRRLLRNVFKRTPTQTVPQQTAEDHGFAFSQEEYGPVTQGELVRSYQVNAS